MSSSAQIRETLAQTLEKQFTGLGLVEIPEGGELKFLIQLGQVVEILRSDSQGRQSLPGTAWAETLAGLENAQVSLIPAPGRWLTCERASFGLPPRQIDENLSAVELGKRLAPLNVHESASLLHLRWSASQAYLLVPGGKLNLRQAILLKDRQARHLSESELFQEIGRGLCQCTVYQGGLESDIWITLHLNLLFEFLCGHLLAQYGYLTGKVMVNSIVKNVLIYASQHDWDLTAASGCLSDQTCFSSQAEAKEAYQSMLHLIRRQMQSMAGTNIVSMIYNQGLDRLNPFYLNLWKLTGLEA
jgi:hypothetical protein